MANKFTTGHAVQQKSNIGPYSSASETTLPSPIAEMKLSKLLR